MKLLSVVGIAAVLAATAYAGIVTMDFEAVGPQGTDVGSFYNYLPGGPVFFGATILQSPDYNYEGYPPESGVNVAYSDSTGEIDVTWTTGVSGISFYLDNSDFSGTAVAYGIGGTVVSSTDLPLTTYGSSGVVVSVPGSGITKLSISGTASYYVIDDVGYEANVVPEPGTLAMFGAAALALAAVRRKLMS